MNKTFYIILALLVLVFAACAPKEPDFRPAEPAFELFDEAESKYEDSRYSESFELFRRYVEKYPDTELAPAAYLKLGIIRAEWGEFEKARQIYERLINKYTDTPYARQARIKILESLVEQGNFREALDYREKLRRQEPEPDLRMRADLLAGDACMALERFRRAYEYFAAAYRQAGPQVRTEIAGRLSAAVSALQPGFIDSELERLETDPPAGFLTYQRGLNLMAEQRVQDSLSVFRGFLERFPDHPMAGQVKEQMVLMTSAVFFEGNTIGCVLPLTGQYAKFGRQALRGIELAIADASQDIDVEPPFRVLVRDSGSDPETARNAVIDLARSRVAAIIGPIGGASEAADTAQRLGVPIIALTQRADTANTGDFVFQNFLTPEMQVEALADYAAGRLGCRNFAVLYPEENYGRTFLNLFRDMLTTKNARLVGAESYNPSNTDFSEPIKKLSSVYYGRLPDLNPGPLTSGQMQALGRAVGLQGSPFAGDLYPGGVNGSLPDNYDNGFQQGLILEKPVPRVNFEALFIPDSKEKAGLIIPQLRYYDINNSYLLGTNLWHSEELIEIAGDQIRDAVIPEGFFEESKRSHVVDFVSGFEKIYAYEPGFIEAVGYDTAMILCRQLRNEGVFSRPALRHSLAQMPPYEGVTGRTEFKATGAADKSIYLLGVSGGRFVEINR
ncbi:MAG: penicillin-binding protein activator [Thermodesulfobacteriota bacterium]